MKVVVLGLEDSFRGSQLILDCQKLGFEVEKFYGLNGSLLEENLSTYYDSSAAMALLGRALTLGEVGCAWSHQRIYERSLTSGDQWTVVLEDDAVILSGFLEAINNLEQLPPGPNIVLLSSPNGTLTGSQARTGFRRIIHGVAGAYAYAINREAAQIAASRWNQRVDYVADWPYRWSIHIQFWTPLKPLAAHRETPTQILFRDTMELSPWVMSRKIRVTQLISGRRIRNLRKHRVSWQTIIMREYVYPIRNRYSTYLTSLRLDRRE